MKNSSLLNQKKIDNINTVFSKTDISKRTVGIVHSVTFSIGIIGLSALLSTYVLSCSDGVESYRKHTKGQVIEIIESDQKKSDLQLCVSEKSSDLSLSDSIYALKISRICSECANRLGVLGGFKGGCGEIVNKIQNGIDFDND